MIAPRHARLASIPSQHLIPQLRAKPQMMYLVAERMRFLAAEVVFEVVNVCLSIGKGLAGREVEVSDDLVDTDAAFDAAAFAALGVERFAVVFAFALFDVLAAAEGPADGGVGIAHFGTGIAAAWFGGTGGCRCAVALAAVGGVHVGGFIFVAGWWGDALECGDAVDDAREAYSRSAFVSKTCPPSDRDASLILLMPCITSLCTSPDTSMTSSVNSSHGIRGKVMFMCISIFSPLPLSTTNSGCTVIRL